MTSIPPEESNDYYVHSYESPALVGTFRETPRFGRSDDIVSLFNDDDESSSDYMYGLAMAASVVVVCFFLLLLMILVFKCCPQRVGFLSGAPFVVHNNNNKEEQEAELKASEDDTPVEQQQEQYPASNKAKNTKKKACCCGTLAAVRLTFILSGIIFITFACLIVTNGITNLQQTVQSVHHSAVHVEYISQQAQDIFTNGIAQIQSVASSVRNAMQEELDRDDFCPAALDNVLDDRPAAVVTRQLQDAVTQLRQIETFSDGTVAASVAAALGDAGREAQQLADQAGDVDLTDWQALLVLILYTVVPSVLVSVTILSHFEIIESSAGLYKVTDCFLLPLFIFMVIVCCLVSSAMLATASANSDFCLPGGRVDDTYPGDSPDATILRMLDAQGIVGKDDFVRKVANWYVYQCQTDLVEDPYTFLTGNLPELVRWTRTVAREAAAFWSIAF